LDMFNVQYMIENHYKTIANFLKWKNSFQIN
jgi:hypothetical protein